MSDKSMIQFRRLLADDGFSREQINRIVILAERAKWEMTKRIFERTPAEPEKEGRE